MFVILDLEYAIWLVSNTKCNVDLGLLWLNIVTHPKYFVSLLWMFWDLMLFTASLTSSFPLFFQGQVIQF